MINLAAPFLFQDSCYLTVTDPLAPQGADEFLMGNEFALEGFAPFGRQGWHALYLKEIWGNWVTWEWPGYGRVAGDFLENGKSKSRVSLGKRLGLRIPGCRGLFPGRVNFVAKGNGSFFYSQARSTPAWDDSPRLPRCHPVPRWAEQDSWAAMAGTESRLLLPSRHRREGRGLEFGARVFAIHQHSLKPEGL